DYYCDSWDSSGTHSLF
nr:immunoglobulin light chain junction region [Macaca mulatta]MOW66222.1 immunoglobulin light chain junction region [Macaca mulatta]MOW66541.1 immunoglobulin light chain junction region [Macaca mulatta]MOW66569.1 immunoglobulin light chain junction region [Macaca mulatta]MOW66824.1 immunoglobulin light chain junction region [Macaca mulatta]